MANILIVYFAKGEYPPRATTADHLYSFRRYTAHNCFYLNLAVRRVPRYLKNVRFDLVVFHTLFLSVRWLLPEFEKIVAKARPLKSLDAVKVALPQDDFLQTDVVCDFVNEFGVSRVFSASPASEVPKIYPTVDPEKVKFLKVFTGYLDDATLAKIEGLAASVRERPVDIGYRAYRALPWLGRHGFLKTRIADLFAAEAPRRGLAADISTRREDTFLGDDWYKFLLRCKYTIGVEGGASLLDLDGSVRRRTDEYLRRRPGASFEEVEAAVFPGLDGNIDLFVITPRHLEACATRTCQVLVEGAYDGVLVAGRHFIELKRDFSNLDEVLSLVKEDGLRAELTERAYRDVVQSGLHTYRNFAEFVVAESVGRPEGAAEAGGARHGLVWAWGRLADRASWWAVAADFYFVRPARAAARKFLSRVFSDEAITSALRRVRGH